MSLADEYRYDAQHPMRRLIDEKAGKMGIGAGSPERDAMHAAVATALSYLSTPHSGVSAVLVETSK